MAEGDRAVVVSSLQSSSFWLPHQPERCPRETQLDTRYVGEARTYSVTPARGTAERPQMRAEATACVKGRTEGAGARAESGK